MLPKTCQIDALFADMICNEPAVGFVIAPGEDLRLAYEAGEVFCAEHGRWASDEDMPFLTIADVEQRIKDQNV